MKLYHYTSFDSFVRIWFTKTLLFAKPGNVNDILERTRGVKTNNILQAEQLQPFSDHLESYKQIKSYFGLFRYNEGIHVSYDVGTLWQQRTGCMH